MSIEINLSLKICSCEKVWWFVLNWNVGNGVRQINFPTRSNHDQCEIKLSRSTPNMHVQVCVRGNLQKTWFFSIPMTWTRLSLVVKHLRAKRNVTCWHQGGPGASEERSRACNSNINCYKSRSYLRAIYLLCLKNSWGCMWKQVCDWNQALDMM